MATLTGQTIASTYDALLKVTDNGPITSSLKLITDGLGNNTALSLSNAGASITGTLSVSSTISASNLSGTNTGDETNATIKTKLGAATTSVDGYLTSTDWNTFNNKQSALTNPITGTGTTNTLPKFTGASALGNSNITDTGSLITLGGDINISTGALGIGTSTLTGYILRLAKNITGSAISYGIRNASGVQSDVSTVYYFDSTGGTQAASFTLANLINYSARQGVIGVGSTVTNQIGFQVASSLIGATNNYGFQGAIPSGLNNYNLYMTGTAANFLAGDVGIGVAASTTSSGPILTTTLTNGGSGYVDGTYTDVASTVISSGGVYALFTVVVSGGIVTSATLTWGGSTYKVGETITVSNTLLGGTGSGLIITVATVDSSSLKIANINGSDITLYRSDSSLTTNDNIGSIKFESNDGSTKASGIQAKISAFGGGSSGGGYLSFFTRATTAGTSLVEGLRVLDTANVFIPNSLGIGTTSIGSSRLVISGSITGGTTSRGMYNIPTIQSDVTTAAVLFQTSPSTQATSFTLAGLTHYYAGQGTIGAGSAVTVQTGFFVDTNLIGAGTNYGFRGRIPAQTNAWNLYMDGTANNYMAGRVGIGSTSLTNSNLNVTKTITGLTTSVGINQSGQVQSDVTATAYGFYNSSGTQATAFTLSNYLHYACDQGTIGATSAITTQTGFQVGSTLIGATNNYGFRGAIPSGTNRFNLYMDGSADNYMAGRLAIGTTSTSGRSLAVSRNMTGNVLNYGIASEGTVQSDVTTSANGVYSSISTQATTFTLSNLNHFFANQGTFGAGSTVTNQHGFVVSALTGATNNYGFRGQVASGTNRWNLYMDGTAANYLNGTTLIGTTTDNSTGAKLQVNGGITYVNIFNRQTASYTLVLTDQNDIVEMNVASANNLTIPLNSSVAFPIGTEIAVLQYGAGQTTIVATVGVTLRSKANALKISGQYAGCTLVKVGTDEWYVIGDLTA